MGKTRLPHGLRWRIRWFTLSKPAKVLLVLLIVAGVATASGTFLASIERGQVVTGAGLALDLNCDTAGDDSFPSVVAGEPFEFCLRVSNPSATFASFHVHLLASCPDVSTAVISDKPSFQGDDVASGGNACGITRDGISKGIAGGGSALWGFSVVYSDAGSVTWTFTADQG